MPGTTRTPRRKPVAKSSTAKKLDPRRALGALYAPKGPDPVVVDVPPLRYLMIDGEGDPNTAPAYEAAIQALYATAYTLKFLVRRSGGPDLVVMPLEGLWWADDMTRFRTHPGDKSGWKWTMMIGQPDVVTPALLEEARRVVREKKGLAIVDDLRLETLREGTAMQLLHTGPYADEGPAIAALHAAIAERGGRPAGRHHEIYLNAPGRTAPARLRTVIRQPFTGGHP